MDANKRAELLRIGYKIHPACGFCKHGQFAVMTDWGVCATQTYEHKKHSDATRQLSIFRGGWCPKFAWDDARLGVLGLFQEFVTPAER